MWKNSRNVRQEWSHRRKRASQTMYRKESNLNKVSVANMEHTPQNEIYLLSDLKL